MLFNMSKKKLICLRFSSFSTRPQHGFKTLEEIGGTLRQKQNWLCEYNIVRNVFKCYEIYV